MIKLITYSDDRMTISAENLLKSAMDNGRFTRVEGFNTSDLDLSFKYSMAHILQHERGAGFYCWKPYIVNKAAKYMNDGDILVWSDAGTTWMQPVDYLLKCMDEDIMFFDNGWRHLDWCKSECWVKMFGMQDQANAFLDPEGNLYSINHPDRIVPSMLQGHQVQASHVLFKLNDKTRRFISLWLNWSTERGVIDNDPSIWANSPTFREHRWDQSILTNLQRAYGYKMHQFPSQYMDGMPRPNDTDNYPVMFEHHRRRNNEW